MRESLSFGIIGSGQIAADFTRALEGSRRCRVVNVLGSTPEKGALFARSWRLPRYARSISELLSDAAVEAVYIATPHPLHEAFVLACIDAGVPVLCEKPLTLEFATSARLTNAARERGVFLMEAFMYRCHPLLRRLLSLLDEGVIGRPLHFRSSFGFRVRREPRSRLFAAELGGGGVLDVGGYPVSLARLIAGRVVDAPFAEPVSVQALGCIGPTGTDELAVALLGFASGFSAQVSCATRHALGTQSVIYGEEGRIELPDAWLPRGERQGLESELVLHRDGRAPELVKVRAPLASYALEAELVADTLPATQAPWPAMSWDDTLGNMRVLEAWRAELARASSAR